MLRLVNLFIKRLVDITGSLISLIVLSPFFLVVAIALKLDSKGPVFFLQERLGRKGKTFKIVKFRTMVVNAESIGEGLVCRDDHDPRVTRVGRFLRRTSLDELPQLINIFVGEMSAVGPRPPVTYHPYQGYEGYPDVAKKRFEMRPGITGLAQVKMRNSATWDERIRVDVEYVEHFNVLLDLKIIFKTLFSLINTEEYTEN